MPRTALFAGVRRALRLAHLANLTHRRNMATRRPGEEAAGLRGITRRQFLRRSATVGGLALAGKLGGCRTLDALHTNGPRIAIVGAGLAGLNAAYRLRQAGLRATVFEGAERTGGRVYTARDLLGPGLTTELGGEFIDTGHAEMLALASELGLELIDTAEDDRVIAEAYFFNGRHHTEAEVIAGFRPVAARIAADYDALGEVVDYRDDGGGTALDRTSVAEYLERVDAAGFVRELLEVAYVTEYGLEAGEQSSLNLVFLIGTDLTSGFQVFGESDERFKIRGGNQRLTDALAAQLDGQIRMGHELVSVQPAGAGFVLVFQRGPFSTVAIAADIVLLALPFTRLRDVDLRVELPAVKRRAIDELGYGTNAKLLLGFERRVWRAQGYSGNIFSDEAYQLAWDNSRGQPGVAGGLTLYSGGRAGVDVGQGTAAEQAARLLPGLERAFPGLSAAATPHVARFHWPTYRWVKASYACYRPGQWTTIAGAEGEPVGNLFFAGEHCSYDYQGYMNGAAESGRAAAAEIATRAGVEAALAM